MEFSTADKLVYRIKRSLQKGQPISFLIGSGVTLSTPSSRGVPSTSEIIDLIKDRFNDDEGRLLFANAIQGKSGAAAYQAAMSLLVQCEGQAALNEVIASAVLHSSITNTHEDILQKKSARPLMC